MYRAKLLIIVALFVARVESGPATFEDLLDLINTTSSIYVYASTYATYMYDNPVTCMFYRKKDLSDTHFEFGLRYKADWRTYDYPVRAKLGDDPVVGGPYMEPNFWPEQSEPARKTLVAYIREQHCGVFTLPRKGKNHCELHLWEDAIIKEDRYHHVDFTCLKYFQAWCGYHWPTIITYTLTCSG
ncbi:uncharacterized protein LOC142584832 isoform X4 [Dermacentor variabilis]|uniref:uncharacterized protein LOC142584832 isoform X4 n=1 Tax=Dermacentor variabilis TaxID=34621 RepID=UPI003F5BBB8B